MNNMLSCFWFYSAVNFPFAAEFSRGRMKTANTCGKENSMRRKTFSRSEQAAILGLAELFRAGFVSMTGFSIMDVGDVEQLHWGGNRWLNRVVTFVRPRETSLKQTVEVTVRTLSSSEYPASGMEELQVWEPCSASMNADHAPDYQRYKHPIPHWTSGRS